MLFNVKIEIANTVNKIVVAITTSVSEEDFIFFDKNKINLPIS